ncbi:MAG: chemotaxis response regulator protein-glutamate methylesterase [Nitrospirae bacterium]|nr:chemotaxis response regulator protein-glutamate methylesterase [Nitrospirota bacterium]
MPKIRVLIVDGSVVIRRLLCDELGKDPDLEVVGTAPTGKIALAKIPQVNPDIVTMDIERPEMDGLEAVTEIRKIYANLPIIMFSTLSQRAAKETLEALSRGANDYVTKPTNVGRPALAMQRVRDKLIPKIKTLCPGLGSPTAPPRPASSLVSSSARTITAKGPSPDQVVDIVAIGVSTGGPNALNEVFESLPTDLPVPIVIVQHMPPIFTQCLAERLTTKSGIMVKEGAPGTQLLSGNAWVAPGGYHMVVTRKGTRVELDLNQHPPENFCRPSVDVLFRSVAQVFGPRTLAVILTGLGEDGLRGCEVLKECGALIIAQDEASSVVWGMPGVVAKAGLADTVLPLHLIANEIVSRIQKGRVQHPLRESALC